MYLNIGLGKPQNSTSAIAFLYKIKQMRYRNQRVAHYYRNWWRSFMNKKIVSLALVLGLFTLLGACNAGGGGTGGTGGTGGETSPSPAETSPAGSPSP